MPLVINNLRGGDTHICTETILRNLVCQPQAGSCKKVTKRALAFGQHVHGLKVGKHLFVVTI